MDFKQRTRESLLLGVLNHEHMLSLVDEGIIVGANKRRLHEETSALDLELSDVGWELPSTFKPREGEAVDHLVQKYNGKKFTLKQEGTIFYKGKIYLVKLQESLNLIRPDLQLYAQASGKSSIGRLDVLTRLLVDNSAIYDEVVPGHNYALYAEILPLSFDILLRPGSSVNQLRLFNGRPRESRLQPELLKDMSKQTAIVLQTDGQSKDDNIDHLAIDLSSIAIGAEEEGCSFVAKGHNGLDPIDVSKEKAYNPKDYWDLLKPNSESLEMQKDSFYILRSKERFCLPDDVAVRCIAYTESLGETRIHYAGFAHPWFGRDRPGEQKKGAPLIFEVRCHSFKVLARDDEDFARIEFYRMAKPTKVKTPYDTQELKLSKCFREWQ